MHCSRDHFCHEQQPGLRQWYPQPERFGHRHRTSYLRMDRYRVIQPRHK
jgi:hypothetical protein